LSRKLGPTSSYFELYPYDLTVPQTSIRYL